MTTKTVSSGGCPFPGHPSPEYLEMIGDWKPFWEFDPSGMPGPDDKDAWRELDRKKGESSKARTEKIIQQYDPGISERTMGGVRVVDICPKNWKDNGQILIHMHGGGWFSGSPESAMTSSVPIAHHSGLRVVSIDYTKAPFASTYYAIIDECMTVIEEIVKGEGYQSRNIGLFGSSAGGALTLSTSYAMHERGLGVPGAIVPVSAMTDFTMDNDTWHTLEGKDPLLSKEFYIKPILEILRIDDLEDPRISPHLGDLTRPWPPTLIVVGTREILLSDSVVLYQALDRAGKTVKLDPYDGMCHGFEILVPNARESKIAHGKIVSWFRKYLGHEA